MSAPLISHTCAIETVCLRTRAATYSAMPKGFTLIELVIAISLSAIVVAFAAMFIITPVKSYQAQTRRAELVDSADAILRLMGRDIRAALPNSIRVTNNGSIVALEMLAAADAVRYRDNGATSNPALELDLSSPDGSFATLSQFDGITRPFTTSAYYLSIYNVGIPGADAYSLTNVITPAGTSITINNSATAGEDLVTLSPAFKFAYGSPGHRVYLVSGPVTYLCDPIGNTLRKYSGYSIAASQSNRDTAGKLNAAGAVSSTVATNIAGCQIDYVAGTSTRAGLVSLRMTITKDGESIWLAHQVHVENAP